MRPRNKLFVLREKEYKEMNQMMKKSRFFSMFACAVSVISLVGVIVCLVNQGVI